jgi:hypothetical protein
VLAWDKGGDRAPESGRGRGQIYSLLSTLTGTALWPDWNDGNPPKPTWGAAGLTPPGGYRSFAGGP